MHFKNMRAEIENVISELKRQKRRGGTSVYIDAGTIESLKNAASEFVVQENAHVQRSNEEPRGIRLDDDTKVSKPAVPKKKTLKVEEKKLPEPPQVALPEGDKQAKWDWLQKRVLECPECNKHVKPGKKVVFGVGDLDAKIFFCGEAPGADEEIQGEPFVGKAGKLLMKIINAMGLGRKDVYIGNIMNWRPDMPTPYGNRPPTQEEMNYCLPFLRAQLDIVKPEVIVALGSTAVNGLLGYDSKRRMGDVRGKWFEFNNLPLMITFHPSYLLRNNTNRTKRLVWEDMLKVMERVGMSISEKQRAFFS